MSVNCLSFTLCTWKLFSCLSLVGSDLNKNEAFNYIRFVPHIRQAWGFERRQTPVSCLAFVNTPLTGADQSDFDSDWMLHSFTGTGGFWCNGVQQDVLDTVLQEKYLHQTSAHHRWWHFQSLVHFQLSVRRQIPSSHHYWRGEEELQLFSVGFFYLQVNNQTKKNNFNHLLHQTWF